MLCSGGESPDIREIFQGIPPPEYRWQLVLMLRASLDGSTSGSPPILSVAGFLGRIPAVARFDKEWRRQRAECGIPHFRMASFMSRKKKPYDAWSKEQRDEIMSRLIGLINDNVLLGVGAALNLDEYKAEIAHVRPPYKPYRICAALCIGSVAKALGKKVDESVMYVVESGDEGEKAFRASMGKIVESSQKFRDEMKIFGITPGTKEQCPSLDAADFLAWQVGQHVPRMRGDKPAPRTPYVQALDVPLATCILRREHMREWVAGHTEEKLQELAKEYGVRVKNLRLTTPCPAYGAFSLERLDLPVDSFLRDGDESL